MKLTFLIILMTNSFIATAQIKKDSVSNYIYPGAFKSARDLKNPDLNLQTYSIDPFNGKRKISDSTYINIYHSKSDVNNNFPPAVYMDSVKVGFMGGVDPKDIVDVKIYSGIDSVNKTRGKIYITLKKHPYHFITIEELTKRCTPDLDSKTRPVIYILDNELVTDTTNMKFEITYIRDVEVIDGSQIKAFKGLLSNVIIIKINTGSAPIYLRGNEPIYLRGNSTPGSFK